MFQFTPERMKYTNLFRQSIILIFFIFSGSVIYNMKENFNVSKFMDNIKILATHLRPTYKKFSEIKKILLNKGSVKYNF